MISDDVVGVLLIDLDDTLYPQADFLVAAWSRVAELGSRHGIDHDQFEIALNMVCNEGSARGGIIDRALAVIGRDDLDPRPFVAAFTDFRPTRLVPYDGVAETLASLVRRYSLALVTDGNPTQQRAKLAATGLARWFDAVICSDDFGRAHRKPDAEPFLAALSALQSATSAAVMIGDSPHKDIAGADALGMRSIRVRSGEYSAVPDTATASIERFAEVESALAAMPRRVRCAGAR